jgi:hypothetical protein
MSNELPIFWVGNHHVQGSGSPPHVDGDIRKRYHGYFENEYGEQAIFVYDYEVNEGILWLGDAGWETPHKVVDGEVAELMLGQNESAWLSVCWNAAVARLQK